MRKITVVSISIALGALLIALAYVLGRSSNNTEQRVVEHKPGLALVAEQPLEEIVKSSEAGLIGKVVDISEPKIASKGGVFYEDAVAYREVTIEVERFLFNNAKLTKPVKIVVLGGSIKLPPEVAVKRGFSADADVIRTFEDEAKFELGERVLVFLKKGYVGFKESSEKEEKIECLRLAGAWQGKYHLDGKQAVNYNPERSKSLKEIEQIVSKIWP